jgi:Multicopper oxidase
MAIRPESFNLVNSPIVDTFYTPATLGTGSWIIVRYHGILPRLQKKRSTILFKITNGIIEQYNYKIIVVSPGVFFLHCHINPHLEGGMGIAIADWIDVWPAIPDEYKLSKAIVEP